MDGNGEREEELLSQGGAPRSGGRIPTAESCCSILEESGVSVGAVRLRGSPLAAELPPSEAKDRPGSRDR